MYVDKNRTQALGNSIRKTWGQGARFPESAFHFTKGDMVTLREEYHNHPTGTKGVVISSNQDRVFVRIAGDEANKCEDFNLSAQDATRVLEYLPIFTSVQDNIRNQLYGSLHEQVSPFQHGQLVRVVRIDPVQNIWKFRPVYPGQDAQIIGQVGQVIFPLFTIPGEFTMYSVMLKNGKWEFTDRELVPVNSVIGEEKEKTKKVECPHCLGDTEEPGAPAYLDSKMLCSFCKGKGVVHPEKAKQYRKNTK